MNFTSPDIKTLEKGQIFVFGSNYAGRHGAGAAKLAKQKFGAREGQGMGLMGQSYGIATKGWRLDVLSLKEIEVQCERFKRYALVHPEFEFLVTEIGCGLAHFKPSQIAPFFKDSPVNVRLPERFWKVLNPDISS